MCLPARDGAGGGDAGEEARTLFVDDAPVGVFAARLDGSILYMNRALRAVLGVGEDPAQLRVKDVIKEDAGRVLRKDRRGFGPTRARVTLRARDGAESQASVLSFWPAEDMDGAARVFVFFSEAKRLKPSLSPCASIPPPPMACSRRRRSARLCSIAPIRARPPCSTAMAR